MFHRKPRQLSTEDKLCIAMHKIGELEAEVKVLRDIIADQQSNAGRALAAKRVKHFPDPMQTAAAIRASMPGRNWRTELRNSEACRL